MLIVNSADHVRLTYQVGGGLGAGITSGYGISEAALQPNHPFVRFRRLLLGKIFLHLHCEQSLRSLIVSIVFQRGIRLGKRFICIGAWEDLRSDDRRGDRSRCGFHWGC